MENRLSFYFPYYYIEAYYIACILIEIFIEIIVHSCALLHFSPIWKKKIPLFF